MYTGRNAPDGRTQSGDGLLPVPVRVSRVRRETADVATIELTPPSAFASTPGQFNMLYVFGLGEVAISLSGDPAEEGTIVRRLSTSSASQAIRRCSAEEKSR